MRKLLPQLVVLLVVFSLTGCFTGIESTPKITADKVEVGDAIHSAEAMLMADVAPQPFSQWQEGKRLYITDDKITLVLSGATGVESLAGTEIVYAGCDSVGSVTGDVVTDLRFMTRRGDEVTYRLPMSPSQLLQRAEVVIPFTIERSVVEQASERLVGKSMYVLTPLWYGADDKEVEGRRFVNVKITGVDYGNDLYPLKVSFEDEGGVENRMFMTLSGRNSTRAFETLFSFENPRNRYPSISDNNWNNIIHSRVEPGMTRDECRLALGSPKEVEKIPTYGGVVEQWHYENGVYLIFEDGLLKQFRR